MRGGCDVVVVCVVRVAVAARLYRASLATGSGEGAPVAGASCGQGNTKGWRELGEEEVRSLLVKPIDLRWTSEGKGGVHPNGDHGGRNWGKLSQGHYNTTYLCRHFL